MNRQKSPIGALVLASLIMLSACGHGGSQAGSQPAPEQPKSEFNIGWSIYAGWMPWPYAQQSGIVKKWADKYGIKINLIQVNDYVESINQYTAGKLDGVTATTMDALTIPAAGGKDSSVVLIGDYSNGNDGIVLKNAKSIADIKGRSVNLVQFSVSHYLLARGLAEAGMSLADVKTVNTGDADIVGAFASPQVTAVVTWNPQLSEVKKAPGANEVFDSSKIPAEILDTTIVSSATLKANPNLGKALAGIWYETLAIMTKDDAKGRDARAIMARDAGTTPESFDAQLKTTFLFARPQDATALVTSAKLITVTDRVRHFSFNKGLFGPASPAMDAIGISFPGTKTLGDPANIKLRFDPSFMKMAADGKL